MLLYALPLLASGPGEQPRPTPVEAGEPKGVTMCARENLLADAKGLVAIPIDMRRGSCWLYLGESATGKAMIAPIEGKTPLPPGMPAGVFSSVNGRPIKIDADFFSEQFVPESQMLDLQKARIEDYIRRWPALSISQATMIYERGTFLKMTSDQAEEAVGWLVHRRSTKTTESGREEIWEVGKKSLAAQVIGEVKINTFLDAFVGRGSRLVPPSPTLAKAEEEMIGSILTFKDGALITIENVSRSR